MVLGKLIVAGVIGVTLVGVVLCLMLLVYASMRCLAYLVIDSIWYFYTLVLRRK